MGRRLVAGLPGPFGRGLRAEGVRPVLVGIATARHGIAIDPRGLPARRAVSLVRKGGSLAPLHREAPVPDTAAFIRRVEADVLVELGPLDPRAGEPALSHVRGALRRGMHVVTANKGPVAFAGSSLRRLARRRGRLFLHEGAVLDGTLVFSLVERCLPGARVLGFRGLVNSTTSLVLGRVEEGASWAEALAEARALGIVEADASHDLDGWDAALKGCALANALMGASVRPDRVARTGIRGLQAEALRRAAARGARIRLVVRGERSSRGVSVTVAPERLEPGDLLHACRGADAALVLRTDLLGEVGLLERGGTADQTAYAVASDLARVARLLPRRA